MRLQPVENTFMQPLPLKLEPALSLKNHLASAVECHLEISQVNFELSHRQPIFCSSRKISHQDSPGGFDQLDVE